ncbi:hypothetical protein [Tychonema sp. LEGE 07203]|uniref:hypothetical protein n=1 Tax=Tychonema sp. LEGE 07203 TaxID=1828671 RepID=UPI0018824238|nr:hypothetical protein [Tychonema sp. LEGE 07203]MBE9093743.1 hypothetical protein [Tychonema sp. LEGE 07203]
MPVASGRATFTRESSLAQHEGRDKHQRAGKSHSQTTFVPNRDAPTLARSPAMLSLKLKRL